MSKRAKKREMLASLTAWKDALRPRLMDLELMKNRNTVSAAAMLTMVSKHAQGKIYEGVDGKCGFIDRNADILFVGHLDSTGSAPHFGHVPIGDDTWIFSRWVDDRLGIFLGLDVLSSFLDYDLLLTTGEESGKSTAFHFDPPKGKSYKWMFELDRMGDDAVYYQYNETEWHKALRESGFTKLQHGSYTDIVDLEHLGICGVNVAIGYEDNHSTWAKANLSVTLEQAAKFCVFYQANNQIAYPHVAADRKVYAPKVDGPETGKSTGALSGHSERRRGSRGYTGTSFPGGRSSGYGHGENWPPASAGPKPDLYPKEVVRMRKTDEYWEVGGEPYYSSTVWRVRLDKPNSTGKSTVSIYPEVSEFRELWYQSEIDEAFLIFPDGLYPSEVYAEPAQTELAEPTEPTPPNEHSTMAKLISASKAVEEDIKTVSEQNAEQYQKLLALCDGLPHEAKTIEARKSMERSYFNRGEIVFHSTSNASVDDKTQRHFSKNHFHFKARVYTPYGQGEIDSYYKVVTITEGNWWWVRFDKPDTSGHVASLVNDVEITLVPPALVALAAPVES